jgi:hypothetical protein
MFVTTALSLLLSLGATLVAPEGCQIVAVWEDGSAVAACADGNTWFEYDPDLTRDGLWSISRREPPQLVALRQATSEAMSQRDPGAVASTT